MNAFINGIKKIINYQRELGTIALWYRIRGVLWNRVNDVIVCKTITHKTIDDIELPENMELKAIDSSKMNYAEWKKTIQEIDLEYTSSEYRIRKWFDCEDILIFGFMENRLAVRYRITTEHWLLNYLPLKTREGAYFSADIYVPVDFRRRGFAQAALFFCEVVAHGRGFKKNIANIRSHNIKSIKLHEKIGATNMGNVTLSSTLGKKTVRWHHPDGTKQDLVYKSIHKSRAPD